MLGERVAGKYELKRLVGSGAMGAVYEGVHVDIGKRLAIKVIRPEFCGAPEIVARFRREARAASAVEGDHIVQIYDFGRDDRLGLYMVIEYLEGEDLEARLARERWIGEAEAAAIGVQIGRGLARAHAAGVIHRDLKPANVFLVRRDDGTTHVKILDFGISKFEPDVPPPGGAEPTLTAFGTTLGTPQYMAPEQCEGKDDVDGRADVWAMATLLYEMLAGEPAVPAAGGHIGVMTRVVREDIPPLASRASWVSSRLAAVVDAGLVRDRNRRIPDASTFVARLLDAAPEAGSRPSFAHIARPTDVSELASAPPTDPGLPVVPDAAPPPVVAAPAPPRGPRPALRPAAFVSETGNPISAEPPSSAGPNSLDGERVSIFERGELPREIEQLRSRRKP